MLFSINSVAEIVPLLVVKLQCILSPMFYFVKMLSFLKEVFGLILYIFIPIFKLVSFFITVKKGIKMSFFLQGKFLC